MVMSNDIKFNICQEYLIEDITYGVYLKKKNLNHNLISI